MVSEEADARLGAHEQLVEPSRLADEAFTATMPFESHAGRRVVGEDDVEVRARAQGRDLVAGVVALRVALEVFRLPLEIRISADPRIPCRSPIC